MIRRFFQNDYLLAGYVAACLVLGGSSAAGTIANAALQLAAVAILAGLWAFSEEGPTFAPSGRERPLKLLLVVLAIWIVLQLLPLPYVGWQSLPGMSLIRPGLAEFGNDNGWRGFAIDSGAVIASALSLLPPLAVLFLGLFASSRALHLAFAALIVTTLLATLVGIVQLLHGPQSQTYLYAVSSRYAADGFFANSNHFGTLLLVGAIMSAAAIPPALQDKRRWRAVPDGPILGAIAVYLLANLVLAKSVAPLALSIFPVAFLAVQAWTALKGPLRSRWPLPVVVVVLPLVVAPVVALAIDEAFGDYLANAAHPESRILYAVTTLNAARDFFPLGCGLGNFRWVYSLFENNAVTDATFVNHAHNDYAELLLEGGMFAVILLGLFVWQLARLGRMAVTRWNLLSRPALAGPWLALFVVLVHSTVDYPLRTTAIATAATLCFVAMLRKHEFNPRMAIRF